MSVVFFLLFSGGPKGRVVVDRSQIVIYAAHVIITAYGFWLPNDQRGSYSDLIRAFDLLKYGDATTMSNAQSCTPMGIQPRPVRRCRHGNL